MPSPSRRVGVRECLTKPEPDQVVLCRSALDENHVAFDEMSQLFFCRVVNNPPSLIENVSGSGYKQLSAEPGPRSQGAQHGQPCILAQDGPEAARRCPDYGDRLSSEDP